MNVKDIRRENMRALADTIGGITAMADRLSRSQSQISHVIGINPVKNIGHKLAAEIEKTFAKPDGWLDKEHHQHVAENEAEYFIMPKFYWAPLISWADIFKLLSSDANENITISTKIPMDLSVSQKTFALQLEEELAISNRQIFPKGSIIIVDPEIKPKNNDFVLTFQKGWFKPQIHKLQITRESMSVQALQTNSHTFKIESFKGIIGVLRKVEYIF